jgi:ornithine cyclodeaminase/alanine dehydrogenase-like protein (mu-crystallin family)
MQQRAIVSSPNQIVAILQQQCVGEPSASHAVVFLWNSCGMGVSDILAAAMRRSSAGRGVFRRAARAQFVNFRP